MATNNITLSDGTHTVTLSIHSNAEADSPANVGEVPIPGRILGGQVQYLGSPQWRYTITGILNDRSGTGGAATAHQDDENDFEEGGYLELIKNNTTSDCTFTQTYNGTTIRTVTVRIIDYVSWPVKGAQMFWFAYTIKLVSKQ